MEALVGIVMLLVSIGLTLWPMRKIAQWMEAGRTGYGACLLALIIPSVLGAIVVIVVFAVGMHPIGAFLIVFLIELAAIAVILDTTVLRALVITVLTTIVATLLMFGLFLLIGLFGLGIGAGVLGIAALFGGGGGLQGLDDLASFEPKTDSAIVSQDTRADGTVVTRYEDGTVQTLRITEDGRFEMQTQGPSSTPSESIPRASPLPDAGRTPPEQSPAPPSPPKPRYTMAYVDADAGSLPAYEGRRLRVTLRNGIQHVGKMLSSAAGTIVLQRRLSGGTVEFAVRIKDIERIEVWSRVAV